MATRTQKQQSDVPAGFDEIKIDAPEGALDLEVNEATTLRLEGVARESRTFAGKRFRIVTTKDGSFFLNGTAKIEQLGLFDMPAGTVVWLKRVADVKIAGQSNPMKDFRAAVQRNGNATKAGASDLPF